ncbi:hypothetical protein [Glaciibacter superstes]|uniref:hypothetical protein n=1 Tax=Glaciibacter superstes TaxID=501023 RepID=UPI0003B3BB09|nr:hypothetical protein [Glaciibacter superstes]
MTESAAQSVHDDDFRDEVTSYLGRLGWKRGNPGTFGELWTRGANDESRLAVPFAVHPESRELAAIVVSLARQQQRAEGDVAQEIEQEFLDVQAYRIADSFVLEDRALLDSAATVLDSARKLIRAAANTARAPRAYIATGFSRPADAIARKARLSHTRRGSFVLPVVMPIEPPEYLANQILDEDTDIKLESTERRTTRTLATALAALDSIAVRPDKEPSSVELNYLVEVGVSKELVTAVRAIASNAGVHAFETRFEWAPGVGTPPGLPDRVLIPDEASSLLARVEKQLKVAKPRPDESISGQIVQIRQVPGEPQGEVTIRTIRNGKMVEIRVSTSAEITRNATDWFRSGRAALAHGAIVARPGRPLSMPEPIAVTPLDQILLDAFSGGADRTV